MVATDERRVVNEATGGEKGSKVARFDLVPPRSLKALAEHFGKACIEHGGKYEARNWQKGTHWSLNYAAAMRHFTQWWSGEDLDEDGNSHLAAVMWHACVLIEFAATHPDLDDRPSVPNPDGPWNDGYVAGWDEGYERALADRADRIVEMTTALRGAGGWSRVETIEEGVTHEEHLELPEWRDQVTWVDDLAEKINDERRNMPA